MFQDREQAGELLAKKLEEIIRDQDYVVAPLLRGGIVVGKKISDYFNIPLMPLAVKKIGAPLNPELGIGAVTLGKTCYFDLGLVDELGVPENYRKNVLENKYKEVKNLQKKIEEKTGKITFTGKNVIVVDDGVATGNTVICASLYLKKQKAKRIILATPVISKDSINNIKKYFDRIISLKTAGSLSSISEFYKYFPQVEDNEVMILL